MSYGNWCGPGWSAGQKKAAKDLHGKDFSVPAVNKLDQACKNHDINIRFAKNDLDIKNANKQFYKEAPIGLGTAFSLAVLAGGPKHASTKVPHSEKRLVLHKSSEMSLRKRSKSHHQYIDPDENVDMGANTSSTISDYDEFGTMEDDDVGEPPVQAMVLRSSGGESAKGQTKETPITKALPTYTLQDTHTTVIPLLYNCSMVGLGHDTNFRITLNGTSMNSPISFTPNVSTPTHNTALTAGIFSCPVRNDANWPLNDFNMGGMLANGSAPAVAGHTYWSKIYEYYTVTDMYYDISVYPMHFSKEGICGFELGQWEESYNASTQNGKRPFQDVHRMKHMEGIKWYSAIGPTETGGRKVHYFKGHYWPGKAKTNVRNDEDVKIWTLVSGSPALREDVVLNFFRPLYHGKGAALADYRFNIVIEMKYVVQYKDRVAKFKFPGISGVAVTLNSSDFYIS